MEEKQSLKTISFKDLTYKKHVSVTGKGKYFIGLSSAGNLLIEENLDRVCVLLLHVTIQENGGCVLSSANTDFTCIMNDVEALTGEMNLVHEMRLLVADRVLLYIDGPVPKQRRQLPLTPGTAVGDAPVKPARSSQVPDSDNQPDVTREDSEEHKWLEKSWCILELSSDDQGIFDSLQTPEQIAIFSASYLTKQLRVFTDAVITTKLLDDVFKLCMDSIHDCQDIYMRYIADVSKALEKVADKSVTRPMHGPAVRFLVELLKRTLEPVDRIILLLDLLRTFSHFECNLLTMAHCQATPAVLGSMSAYLDVIEVQRYAADILAKMATYKPKMDKKAPVREVAVDMLVRGVEHHSKDLALCRAACRVLANISSTLLNILNAWLDSKSGEECSDDCNINKYEEILLYTFEKGIPLVQMMLANFSSDLGVNTEGRKFIYFYAKLSHLQLKKQLTEVQAQKDKIAADTKGTDETDYPDEVPYRHDLTLLPGQLLTQEMKEEMPQGILKRKSRYEQDRSPGRKIVFADDTVGGSESEMYSSSDNETEAEPDFESCPSDTEEFSSSLVHHFVRKTIRRRSLVQSEVESGDSELSDSDTEFLESLPAYGRRPLEIQEIHPESKPLNSESGTLTSESTPLHYQYKPLSPEPGTLSSESTTVSSENQTMKTDCSDPETVKSNTRNSASRSGELDTDSDKAEVSLRGTDKSVLEDSIETRSKTADRTKSDDSDSSITGVVDKENIDRSSPTLCITNEISNDEKAGMGKPADLEGESNGKDKLKGKIQNLGVNETITESKTEHGMSNKSDASKEDQLEVDFTCLKDDNNETVDKEIEDKNIKDVTVTEINTAIETGVTSESKDCKTTTSTFCKAGNTEAKEVNEVVCKADNTEAKEVNEFVCKAGNTEAKEVNEVICKAGNTEAKEVNEVVCRAGNIQAKQDNAALLDVAFLGKLVRTQIIVHVGSLVFQGEDSKVLMVIDQPITDLLENAGAPSGLVVYAGNQYGKSMTLMDLEPGMVINVIDAVRYRSVTTDLVHGAILSVTRALAASLQETTVGLLMLFYKNLFSDQHLTEILTEENFLKEFRRCFENATERLSDTHSVQEMRASLAKHSAVV